MKVKLFDLCCNGKVIIRKRKMDFINCMKNTYKKLPLYRGCFFEVKYNCTIS